MFDRQAIALSMIIACVPVAQAQVTGRPAHLPQRDRPYDIDNLYAAVGFAPLCHDDRMYSLEAGPDKKSPTGKRVNLHAYAADGEGSLLSRELAFPVRKGEDFALRGFFLADDRPSVLYRIWEKKTGLVTLLAQSYDPITLEPNGIATEIGRIPFDAKTYYGTGPYVDVRPSPDGAKILFYFDKIKLNEVQLVMCWVTDPMFKDLWHGIYKIPAQSIGFSARMHFADDAAVYLVTTAVLLTEESVKEKADGTEKIKVKTNYYKHQTVSLFKLHGEEFRMWDASLPGGWEKHGLCITAAGDKVYYGTVVSRPDHDEATHWLVGVLGADLDPGEPVLAPINSGSERPDYLSEIVMDRDGSGYLIGRNDDHTIVCSLDTRLQARWERGIKWKSWGGFEGDPVPFVRDGLLYIGANTYCSQAGHEDGGELLQKGANNVMPVLVSFSETGKPRIEDLFGKADGGFRMFNMVAPNYLSMRDCGYFVDYCYTKKSPGLVRVPVR